MYPAFSSENTNPVKLYLFKQEDVETGLMMVPLEVSRFARGQKFTGAAGQTVCVPNAEGVLSYVVGGVGDGSNPLSVAQISAGLTEANYKLENMPKGWSFDWVAAGWADGAYRFDRYLSSETKPPRLIIPDDSNAAHLQREAEAVQMVRDLVNTPPDDMGPDAIEAVIRDMAHQFGAEVSSVIGDDLLAENYPMIHAVGRAADIPPRIVELSWGDEAHPELALVGKGVSFDTGGLNIKTGNYMRIMKKDMGGAAHAIALARLIMGAKLPVRLKLYIPTVENAVSGNAFRPGDILASRKGVSVEIDNTDAEGRLILGDALARASEGEPDLLIDFATLTGAARVALGPDLAPFYTDDETLAEGITKGALTSGDPVWRMPLWSPYLSYLKSPIADIVNSGSSMGGSITAALFLKTFVNASTWVHLDVWAWREAKYGRPAGAAACGLRAIWAMLEKRYAT
jgi:leucyl aminopeptidase